jgi:hypothetical protein
MKINKEGHSNSFVDFVIAAVVLTVSAISALPQSAGDFNVVRSVIAPGGTVSGGQFRAQSAFGQPVAGNMSGGQFTIEGGFLEPALQPTAASVSLSGRVTARDGLGVRNSIVMLHDVLGTVRTTRTSDLGYFYFDGVPVGHTYVVEITNKVYTFSSQSITVYDEISDLSFIALD